MASSFRTLPIIDFQALQDEEQRSEALRDLKHALFSVGFLYLANTGLEGLIKETHEALPAIFELPDHVKEECNMINSPSFLGYTALGAETTAKRTDLREQFDFGSPVEAIWKPGDPMWKRLQGPSQARLHALLRMKLVLMMTRLVNRYIHELSLLSKKFLHCVAECLSLPEATFEQFLGRMDRLKFVKYPPAEPGSQGVGPHKDSSGQFTFLSQDTVGGLQVLNRSGEWIDAPPIEGTLVVNIAQGFEAITGGRCPATSHRVISPTKTTRYSVPFFLGVRLDLTLDQLKESAADIVRQIPGSADRTVPAAEVASEFLSPLYSCFGEAHLRNRIVSHPDVGQRWYPDLYEKYSQVV
ncbi:hypothetical protein A1O1_03086 [Capronia coronata CBS 617.96]|uniref:Fe2OG dioxygenase domain-containing protein n=1 Tax=Capronia coronata CBS 617.96 TaxID=1182541 RepID=W9ZJJ4_9EURO|nr:uncharacterized protein A1O1_03086 [Capronia coronata CBS 617.96]EXJ94689.1 hypothetical protein A1O1_03086 [Capronia coronata CBS 617.96]